jgi:hypothetical protein
MKDLVLVFLFIFCGAVGGAISNWMGERIGYEKNAIIWCMLILIAIIIIVCI